MEVVFSVLFVLCELLNSVLVKVSQCFEVFSHGRIMYYGYCLVCECNIAL